MSYIFFKKGIRKRCYWCSVEDGSQLTRDHLPPLSIFPKQERKGVQLITAPICNKCKALHHKSEDDNIFLRHMLFWASQSSRSQNIDRDLEELIKDTSLSKSEKIIPAEYLTVELSTGEIVEYLILKGGKESILRVLDSIARAFYYRMREEIISEGIPPNFVFRPREDFNPVSNPLTIQTPCVVKKNVFEFSPVLYEDGNFRYLCWEFKFYNLKPLPVYYSYYL